MVYLCTSWLHQLHFLTSASHRVCLCLTLQGFFCPTACGHCACNYITVLCNLTPDFATQSNCSCFLPLKMASVISLVACELLEIRLSTVIVHCVETSVIVNQNVLRDFSTQELKMAEQMNN